MRSLVDTRAGSQNTHDQRHRASVSSPELEGVVRERQLTQMTSFYDDKDLEEELSRVNCLDEDLEFEYLFEYEPPCSDFAAGYQGWSRSGVHGNLSALLSLSRLFEGSAFTLRPVRLYSFEGRRKTQEVNLTGIFYL